MQRSFVEVSRSALWSSDYVLALLIAHALFASYMALVTMVPLYVLHLDGAEWQIGVVVGSFGVASFFIRPFAGQWTRLLGAKRVALAGSAIFAVASLLYLPALNVWLLIPVRMLQGIGLAMTPVATVTMVANLVPPVRRAEGLGNHVNAIALASLYAPFLSYALVSTHGFAWGFVGAAGFAAIAALAALGISPVRVRTPEGADAAQKVPLIAPGALLPTAVFISYAFTTAPVHAYLPLLAEDRNLGNPGLYFTANSLATMAVLLGAGRAADRLGQRAMVVPGLLLAGAGMFALFAAHHRLMLLGAAVLVGAGFAMIQPALQSFTVGRVPPNQRSAALATLQSGWDIGGNGGALLLGPVAGVLSAASTFAIAGAGVLVGAAGFGLGTRRVDPPSAER